MKLILGAMAALIASAHVTNDPNHTHKVVFGTAHSRSGQSFTPDTRFSTSDFYSGHGHSDTDPSSYMYLLDMYDQWGVQFGTYDQEDVNLGLAYVMYALEQLQVAIEEMKQ